LGRLDPAELEARFARGGRGKADTAQYWSQFTAFYRSLLDRPDDHLPPTFVEAFAAAYKESLRPQTLDMPRSVQPKLDRRG
jgi:predicted component of type VI protein secretion system